MVAAARNSRKMMWGWNRDWLTWNIPWPSSKALNRELLLLLFLWHQYAPDIFSLAINSCRTAKISVVHTSTSVVTIESICSAALHKHYAICCSAVTGGTMLYCIKTDAVFLRAAAVTAVACLSHRSSVRPSVTRVDQSKGCKLGGAKWEGVGKNCDFQPIHHWLSESGRSLWWVRVKHYRLFSRWSSGALWQLT